MKNKTVKYVLLGIGLVVLSILACSRPKPAGTATATPELVMPTLPPELVTPEAGETANAVAPQVTPTLGTNLVATTGWVEGSIGTSANGQPIKSFTWGTHQGNVRFVVCDLHGDDKTKAVCNHIMTAVSAQPSIVPQGMSLVVIPTLNVDGALGLQRANAHAVDLNRNWDFAHVPQADHGQTPFSEPETAVLRDFALQLRPTGTLFYHSEVPQTLIPGDVSDGGAVSAKSITMAQAMCAVMPGYDVFVRTTEAPLGGIARKWFVSNAMPAIDVDVVLTNDTPDLEVQWLGFKAFLLN